MRSIPCLVLFLAACGGGGDDGGSGSGTLAIDADVQASPELSNASAPGDFTTELQVRVTRNGAPVTTGEVLFDSDGGEVALAWNDSENQWRGVQAGYFEVYELHVTSGDDYVHGVRVDAPDIHVFTSPATDASIDATAPLAIAWDRGDEAESATLETRETDEVAIGDSGAYQLAAGTLRSKPDEPEEDELRIARSSRITPDGAVAGSELRVEIENRLELLIAPTGF